MHDVLPALAEQGLTLHRERRRLSRRSDRAHVDAYFHANVFPVLTPLAVDPGHPFPYISNLSLSLAVVLRGRRRRGALRPGEGARRSCRGGCRCRRRTSSCRSRQVIGANLEALFPGVEILGWYTFRITRNTDLQIDHGDEAEDLLSLIQEEVRNRRFAEVVRIEVHASMPRVAPGAAADGVQRAAGPADPAAHARRSLRGGGPAGHGRPAHARVARPAGAQGPGLPPGHAAPAGHARATSST